MSLYLNAIYFLQVLEDPWSTRFIYNRIPKCGSTTVNKIFDKLSDMGRFNIHHSPMFDRFFLSERAQVGPLSNKDIIIVADPGFSWGGTPTPKVGLFCKLFAENCMKMKEFGPRGRPWRPPPWIRQCIIIIVNRNQCWTRQNSNEVKTCFCHVMETSCPLVEMCSNCRTRKTLKNYSTPGKPENILEFCDF